MMMRTAVGLSVALLVFSTTAMAKEAEPKQHQSPASIKAKSAKPAAVSAHRDRHRPPADRKLASRATEKRDPPPRVATRLPPPDEYIGPIKVVGARQVGSAAWYGGRHVGQRTASGSKLDDVHATAAHRSLPLLSLVRVTNLANGHSVICKITDRGPVSRSLLIDVSPSVAEALEMKRAGIVNVAIEPVVAAGESAH